MKAALYERYGPPEVVEVREVPKPVPAADELLVKVVAATLAAGDGRMRRADPFVARIFNGLLRPKRVQILGFELAGEVEAVGQSVERFRPGDRVFSFTGFGFGAHAEYRCLKERGSPTKAGLVALMPTTMSFAEAAAVPVGALTAQAFFRRAQLHEGERVVIYGASGSVGTFAIQLARHLGAHVTAVCSTSNLELVRSLGADAALDYTGDDFARHQGSFDVVFDAVGKCPAPWRKRVLQKGGRFVSVAGSAKLEADDLESLRNLAESGVIKSVIDRQYPLAQIAEAHRYVDEGHKKGSVVILVAPVAGQ